MKKYKRPSLCPGTVATQVPGSRVIGPGIRIMHQLS